MNELPPHLAALLEGARQAHDPSEADRARVFGALQTSLGVAVAAGAISHASSVAAGASSTPSLVPGAFSAAVGSAAKWWIVGVLAVGGSGVFAWWPDTVSPTGAAVRASLASPEAHKAPQELEKREPNTAHVPDVERIVSPVHVEARPRAREQRVDDPAPPEPREQRTVSALAPLPRAQVKPASAVARKARRAHSSSVSAGSLELASEEAKTESAPAPAVSEARSSTSNQGELAIVRATLTALRDKRPHDALELLDEHARQYPRGAMAHERAGLRVVALCDAGQIERGLKEQAAFLETDSTSALAQRVQKTCPRSDTP